MKTKKDLLLTNGRIVDPINNRDETGDILIENGKISAFGTDLQKDSAGKQIFDCTDKLILPGLIDMHVHLREPGEEYKETIQTGTKAAAAGGFTAVASMPNTDPVNDCQAVTQYILNNSVNASARVYPVGAISKGSKGENLADFGEMKEAGVVALSDDGRPVTDSQLMRRGLEYASNFELPVISHSEDICLAAGGSMNEGFLSTKLGLTGIPKAAEEIMIYRDISLALLTGCPIHIAHISTEESVDLIRCAKAKGCKVTAETAPHYFTLTEEAVAQYDTNAKMNPPLRSKNDIDAIRQGLKDGIIDVVASDHAPHSTIEKELEFGLAANGIIGLETSVSLVMALVRDGIIDLARMVELLSINPARILGIQGGTLSPGAMADITVVDPEKEFLYEEDQVVSKSSNSPFLRWTLKGKAEITIVGGVITYQA